MATTKRLTPGREGYKILFNENTVIMNHKFAAAAAKYGTKENRIIRNIRHDFPGMAEVVVSGRECDSAKANTRLTYERMAIYIREQDDAATLMVEFKKQISLSKVQTNPYRCVLAWFIQKFENYDDYKIFFAEEAKKKAQEKNIFTVVKSTATIVDEAADEDDEFDLVSGM